MRKPYTKDEINQGGWIAAGFLDMSKGAYGHLFKSALIPNLTVIIIYDRRGARIDSTYIYDGASHKTAEELLAVLNKDLTGGTTQGEQHGEIH